jgi:hypothetical protein
VSPFGETESGYDESNAPADQTVKPICVSDESGARDERVISGRTKRSECDLR